ncbi:hypothetical protein AAIR29_04945 [Psychrobacter sp. FBL11]|uniref:P pilus assembly/Cpx signaling pathway, periplasmic inhibitor/zinc-resistance associated protein n=1 Tax=Psychrobacter saeujeotis TaxID=3143436 RepID=A0ABU9X9D9_9GAMM|nr:hypothetical protein [uncultured Psychrobacter sp.]
MKKLLMGSALAMSSVLAVTACTSVNATTDTAPTTSKMQHHKTGMKDGMHKGGMRGPLSQLDLTATQQAQLQALKQNNRSERMQNREAMLAILTAEQRAQLETLKSERQAKGHRHSHNKGGKNSPLSELNLTATQRAQIATIRQNNSGSRIQNRSAIMQVLTAEQRQKLEAIMADRMTKGDKGLDRQKMQN